MRLERAVEPSRSASDRAMIADSLRVLRRAIWREALLGAAQRFHDFDFSLVHLAVLLLLEEAGAPSIKQVSIELGRSLSATSRLLDQLVQRGLLNRREDERDRRTKRVSLTAAGRSLLASMEQQRAEAQMAVMQYLSAEEQAQVVRGMALLAEASRRRRAHDRRAAVSDDLPSLKR